MKFYYQIEALLSMLKILRIITDTTLHFCPKIGTQGPRAPEVLYRVAVQKFRK